MKIGSLHTIFAFTVDLVERIDDPDLKARLAELGDLKFTYLPSRIGKAEIKEIERLAEQKGWEAEVDTANKMIAAVVSSWTLEDDDGKPLPITVESCEKHLGVMLPQLIVGALWSHMNERSAQGEGSGANSSKPSAETAKPKQKTGRSTSKEPRHLTALSG